VKRSIFLAFLLLTLTGCTSTLPEKMTVKDNYSLLNVKTYAIKVQCEKGDIDPNLPKAFASNYCQMLEGAVKMALAQTNPEFQPTIDNADLNINIALEALHGGSAAARALVGFGAGRSVSTVYVSILKGTESLAETRITETTTMPNIASKNWTNEDALMQDIPAIAKNVAAFISDPLKYQKETKK
jgi:hypothetical protein